MTEQNDTRDGQSIDVLVVDDSPVIRKIFKMLLAQDDSFVVRLAEDPILAMELMGQRRPDVMVLDLHMPRMDGLTFLRKIMAEDPMPVVICSSYGGPRTAGGIRALQFGAVAIIGKPQIGSGDALRESSVRVLDTIRGAARAVVGRARQSRASRIGRTTQRNEAIQAIPRTRKRRGSHKPGAVIAIGASTGGTEALRTVLSAMPADAPPIVVVQHMPEVFTGALARYLDRCCTVDVKEAGPDDSVVAGQVLIAPGDRHMRVRREGSSYLVELADEALVSRHRPSVDVLLHSVAEQAGDAATGVLLTGMGEDGVGGLLAMRRVGASTLAQDQASCVVFDMPRLALERGAVEQLTPLAGLAEQILRHHGY